LVVFTLWQLTSGFLCPEECVCRSLSSSTHIDCSNSDLTTPPSFARPAPNRVLLTLSGNRLRRLPNQAFGNLTNIAALFLNDNELEALESGWAGASASSLLQLYLANNRLANGNSGALDLDGFTVLDYLDISNNGYNQLPSISGVMDGLSSLSVSGNSISYLREDDLQPFNSLTSLYMADNVISSIHSQALAPVNSTLRYLDLSNNSLSSSDFLLLLEVIESLLLHDNNITLLELGNLSFAEGLRWLSASNNPIGNISLNGLSLLQRMECDRCELTTVEFPISGLDSLLQLSLSANHLTEIPANLHLCSELQRLNLSYNELQIVPHTFKQSSYLTKLTSFDFSGNRFVYVPRRFIQQRFLEKVDMHHGELHGILDDTFNGNSSRITRIDLSYNQISYVGINAFKGISSRATIDLTRNQIVTLFEDIFTHPVIGLTLSYWDNPYVCDCLSRWLVTNMTQSVVHHAVCVGPATLDLTLQPTIASTDLQCGSMTTYASTTITTPQVTSTASTSVTPGSTYETTEESDADGIKYTTSPGGISDVVTTGTERTKRPPESVVGDGEL